MNVGLHLMTEKGLAVLDAALESGVEISYVATAAAVGMNDRSAWRIADHCENNGIPVFIDLAPLDVEADIVIAAGWRWMIKHPNLIVLHDSLLPRYRGFSPLITALVNGEREIGVTAFQAEAMPDTGPIIAQRAIRIDYPIRMREALNRIVPLYREIAARLCALIAGGMTFAETPQDHSDASWSVWRDEDDYRIDWCKDAAAVCRLVDAASDPFPGAWTICNGELLRIHDAAIFGDARIEDRVPGKVFRISKQGPVVVCGSGLVVLPGCDVPLRTLFR